MTDPHDRPAPGTLAARNFDDAFVPGPTDYKDGIACPDFSEAKSAEQRELEMLRAELRELSDQFITNAQRLGSVCDNWHNWAVEIMGKEAARKMSGQDMRDEILRRLACRGTQP